MAFCPPERCREMLRKQELAILFRPSKLIQFNYSRKRELKMKSTKFLKRTLASLLAVLLLAGCFSLSVFAINAGFAGADGVIVTYENGVATILFSSEKLAAMISQKKVTLDDLKSFFPDELYEAFKDKGIPGVLMCESFSNVFKIDELLELIPEEIIDEVFTKEAVEAVADPEEVFESLTEDQMIELYEIITGEEFNAQNINWEVFNDIQLNGSDLIKILSKAVETGAIDEQNVEMSQEDLEELFRQALYKVFTYTDDLTINDESVWVNYKVDDSLLEKVLLENLPTKDDLTDPEEYEELVVLDVVFDIDDTISQDDVEFRIVIGAFGDADISKLADYFSYDSTTGISAKLPFRASQYLALLQSEDLDADTKAEILDFFSTPIVDVVATIEDYDVDTICAIFDAIFGGNDVQSLADFSDSKVSRIYDLIISMLKSLPESVQEKSLLDQYDEENNEFSATYKFGTLLNKLLNKVADKIGGNQNIIEEFFTFNSGNAASTAITVSNEDTDIARVTFVVSGSENFEYTTFLPAGYTVEALGAIYEDLDHDFVDEDDNAVTEFTGENITVYYTDQYCVIFQDEDGNEVETVYYLAGDTEIDEPEIPEKAGYAIVGWSEYELGSEPVIIVTPVYDFLYTIVFLDEDGNEVATVYYVESDTEIEEPEIPEIDGYYAIGWSEYELCEADVLYIYPVYQIYYKVVFLDEDGDEVETVYYRLDDTEIEEPDVPGKDGYYGGWAEYELGVEEFTYVSPVYEKIPYIDYGYYAVIFYEIRGEEVVTIDVVRYRPGARSIVEPPVPSKPGYTGTWAPYNLNEAIVVSTIPVYTQNETYTVVFVDEAGKEVARVDYLVGVTSITEPAVPAKTGYIGAWESYELGVEKTITVKPVYTVDPSTTTESSVTETTEKITTEETSTSETTEKTTTEGTTTVETTEKVTTEKVTTEETTSKVEETTTSDSGEGNKGDLTWLWILLAIILLLVIIILILVFKRKKDDDNNDENKEDKPEETSSEGDAAESKADDAAVGAAAGAAAAGAAEGSSEEAPAEEASAEEAPAEEAPAEEAPAEEAPAEEAPAEEAPAEEAPAEEAPAEEAPAEEASAEEAPAEGEDDTKKE